VLCFLVGFLFFLWFFLFRLFYLFGDFFFSDFVFVGLFEAFCFLYLVLIFDLGI
jgi:hypothetical protein